jgi:methylisocitrate lyase
MVIWPVSSLRVANKAQAALYAALARDGATNAMLPHMQTRKELYETIGLGEFEALDSTIAASVAPDWTA